MGQKELLNRKCMYVFSKQILHQQFLLIVSTVPIASDPVFFTLIHLAPPPAMHPIDASM